jgi:glycosyltransferase involved in cell wall biosynthesis
MKKICFVLTAEFAVKAFLLNHLLELSKTYDVTVITNTDNPNFLTEVGVNVKVIPLAIARDISLFSDFGSLVELIKIFHQEGFSSVHSVTPKSGLLAILAAWVVRVPLRIHIFTGQVWATKTGFSRFLLKCIDCLIAHLTTSNIVDSPSQRQFLLSENVIALTKSIVFSKGSISGVDVDRFKPNDKARVNIRQQFHVGNDEVLFLFVGRLTRDKGVLDLAEAFSQLPIGDAHLFFVGPDEKSMQDEIMRITEKCSKYVHFLGHTNAPESYMATADVLCLPSYREGFGSVVIEAAAVGIPTIASRIYGITDAVVDGETGLLHEPHDVSVIRVCMESMISNKGLRLKFGEQARTRAVTDFNSNAITQEWVSFYRKHIY